MCAHFRGIELHLCDDGAIQSVHFEPERVKRSEVLDQKCPAGSSTMLYVSPNECIRKFEAWKNSLGRWYKLTLTPTGGKTKEYSGWLHGSVL